MAKKRVVYEQVYDGDPFYPTMKAHLEQCCDCGLVHRVKFEVVDRDTGKPVRTARVKLTVWRHERRTAAVRRGFKFNREED